MTKATLTVLGVIVVVALIITKKDRRSEDVTPLTRGANGLQTRRKPSKDAPRYCPGEYPQQCKK